MVILESCLNQLVSTSCRLFLWISRCILSASPWHSPSTLIIRPPRGSFLTEIFCLAPLIKSTFAMTNESKTQSWSSLNLLIAFHWLENEDVLFGQLHVSLTMWPWPSVLILSLCLVSELHSNKIHLHLPDCVRLPLPSSCWSIWEDRPCCHTWQVFGYTSFQGHFLDEAPADRALPRVCAPSVTLKNTFLIALTLVFHTLGYIFSQAEGQNCALFLEGLWCSAQARYAAGPSYVLAEWMKVTHRDSWRNLQFEFQEWEA